MKTSPFRAKWAVTWPVMGALALLSLGSPSWAQQKAAAAPVPAPMSPPLPACGAPLHAAIMAGAAGYVLKQIRGSDLVDAIRRVAAGNSLLDPSVTTRVLERLRAPARQADPLDVLTPQERRILDLIAEGKTNRQIGEAMYLAEKTVKNYVSTILSKLEVARRAEAAAYLARHTTLPGSQ